MTNQEQYDMLWENAKKEETMKKQYIDLLQTVRNDAYQLGYIDGKENANAENAKRVEMLQNEIHFTQKRANWLQDKLIRTKENYDGQVCNLQKKIDYYEEILHRGNYGIRKADKRDC